MFEVGQKVKASIAPSGIAEVVRVHANGKLTLAYWVTVRGKPELWKETISAKRVVVHPIAQTSMPV